MNRILHAGIIALLALSINIQAGVAQSTRADKYIESGQQAFDAGDFAKAESNYGKALKELDSAGATNDQKYATVLKRLAQSCRKNQEYADAGQYLNRAITVCKAINFGDPEINQEFAELSKQCAIVDLERLGTGSANTLRTNSAVIVITKSGSANSVKITVPARFEKNLNSDKIDQMGLEKECTFNISDDPDGTVKVTDIKGFKIHSVEKNMWVNLLGCQFGPANAEGKHESIISAGKMGVVKNVNSSISPRTYEPVGGIIEALRSMGQPVEPPLTIIAGSPSTSAETSPVSSSTVSSPPASSASVSSPPVTSPTISPPPVSSPADSATPVSSTSVSPKPEGSPISTPPAAETSTIETSRQEPQTFRTPTDAPPRTSSTPESRSAAISEPSTSESIRITRPSSTNRSTTAETHRPGTVAPNGWVSPPINPNAKPVDTADSIKPEDFFKPQETSTATTTPPAQTGDATRSPDSVKPQEKPDSQNRSTEMNSRRTKHHDDDDDDEDDEDDDDDDEDDRRERERERERERRKLERKQQRERERQEEKERERSRDRD